MKFYVYVLYFCFFLCEYCTGVPTGPNHRKPVRQWHTQLGHVLKRNDMAREGIWGRGSTWQRFDSEWLFCTRAILTVSFTLERAAIISKVIYFRKKLSSFVFVFIQLLKICMYTKQLYSSHEKKSQN